MSTKTPYFTDRLASSPRNPITYSQESLSYVTQSLPVSSSVLTPAMQRLGPLSDEHLQARTLPLSRSYESNGVGGARILNVILPVGLDETNFQNGNEQMNMRHLDTFRTGKNIKSYKHFSSQVFRPMIRMNVASFYEDDSSDVVNHGMYNTSYGMGFEYKTIDENYKLMPVKDFSQLIPKQLVGKKSVTAYPFVHTNRENFEQFTDPSHPSTAGSIDVFEVRRSIANLSNSDIQIYGVKSDFLGGGITQNKKGSIPIESRFEINKSSQIEIYLDSEEKIFTEARFKTRGVRLNAANLPVNVMSQPGFLNDDRYVLTAFSDTTDHITGSYSFVSSISDTQSFLSSSRNRISAIGSRFKSATNGLIFGESNPLGTDSIAFGGLKK